VLLVEPAAAGVVFAGWIVAAPAPIPKREQQLVQFIVIGQYCSPLAHGDMVGRVKAVRGNMTEGASIL